MKSSDKRRSARQGPRAGPRPDRDRPDHRRSAVAVEAARIMQEQGLADYRGAKAKAAERLGLGRNAPLPNNAEIEAALAERNRIFHSDTHQELLDLLRSAACEAMRGLEDFHPRLAGDVLSGHTTEHSGVELHLFSDCAEDVGTRLSAVGFSHRSLQRRYRLRRETADQYPAYRFTVAGCEVTGVVFPLRLRGHAPLSPVDGRPMRRAGLREVAELLRRDGTG